MTQPRSTLLPLVCAVTAVLCLSSCGAGARLARRIDPCDFRTVTEGRYAGRTYRVCEAESTTLARRPLVVGLHGGGSNAAQFILISGGDRMNELAASEGFIAVYPNGSCTDGSDNYDCDDGDQFFWNDCRGDSDRAAQGDDIGYLRELVATILPEIGLRFDRDRIYFWGHSNGAVMTFRVARELGTDVAGIAAVSGTEPAVSECSGSPAPGTRVLLMHGDQDDVVPPGYFNKAGQVLEAAGFEVYGHVMQGTGHGIAPDGLSMALTFMADKLGIPLSAG